MGRTSRAHRSSYWPVQSGTNSFELLDVARPKPDTQLVNHWLDARRLIVRQPTYAFLLLLAACNAPPIVVPAPPPPAPPIASTPEGRAVLALAASTPHPLANVEVKDDTARHPIEGSTVSDIGKELGIDRGNSDSDYVGATAAEVQWQFKQRRVGDTCAIADVLVTLEIQTRLPEWVHTKHVSTTLVQQWNAFLKATEQHENGHRNIALHTAISIANSLEGEHGLTCGELGELANASARAQWELGNQHQLTYDVATRRGETQGSRWPPFLGSPP
jgi:predicted secreted Zn-dependent protease